MMAKVGEAIKEKAVMEHKRENKKDQRRGRKEDQKGQKKKQVFGAVDQMNFFFRCVKANQQLVLRSLETADE